MINVQKMILTMLNDDLLLKNCFKRCWTVRNGVERCVTVRDGGGGERRLGTGVSR
jgi:hypothetical protein